MFYRVAVIFNGQRWRIMDTLRLDEAIERVVGGGRWRGLVRGAVITDNLGNLIDPRMYSERKRPERRARMGAAG